MIHSLEAQMTIDELRNNDMMAHLLDALHRGKDIGHYGRLVFTIIAHHFLDDEQLVEWLTKDESFDEPQARALVLNVRSKNYSPPRREKILEFQSQQDFPICPTDDPDACNVYKKLKFPQEVYEQIQQYYEQKASS